MSRYRAVSHREDIRAAYAAGATQRELGVQYGVSQVAIGRHVRTPGRAWRSERSGPRPRDFWGLVDQSGDCWLWTGPLDRGGYGKYHHGGRTERAHRYSFASINGDIGARNVCLPSL